MDADADTAFPPLLFSDSNRPPADLKVNMFSKLENVRLVKDIVGKDIWTYVTESAVGVIAKFEVLNFRFSRTIVHGKLLRNQLACENENELWFLIAGRPAMFSLFEFEDITGLNCGQDLPSVPSTVNKEATNFFKRFPLKTNQKAPSSADITQLCKSSRAAIGGWSREDKIRLSYLAILADCLLAVDKGLEIPFEYAQLVMSLQTFEAYPWGRVCFQTLCDAVKSVNKKFLTGGYRKSYALQGFVQVLQVYTYVHVPSVGSSLGLPIAQVDPELPPLLRYRGIPMSNASIDKPFQEVYNSSPFMQLKKHRSRLFKATF